MKSIATAEFWDCFHALPEDVKRAAERAYDKFQLDPFHPGLHFKSLGVDNKWSVRIGLHYRAIGARTDSNTIVWNWIGSHERYNGLIG